MAFDVIEELETMFVPGDHVLSLMRILQSHTASRQQCKLPLQERASYCSKNDVTHIYVTE